jgi:glucokinase
MTKSSYIIAGDIGGTNSRFALHVPGTREPLLVHIYPNEEALKHAPTYHEATLGPFLDKCFDEVAELKGVSPDSVQVIACLAAAGPVKTNNSVFMTNIAGGCTIDGNEIEKSTAGKLGIVTRCKLVNDFVGQGYGALDLDLDSEVVELVPGSKAKIDDLGPKVCVGAGTGLGQCFLTKSSLKPELGYECYPSEGGHVDFVPRGALEVELLDYLKTKFNASHRVSVERVVSGRGLANVYEFLAQKFPERVDAAIHEEFLNAGDQQGKVIGVNSGKAGSLMEQASDIMISAYGSEVGSASLKFIPTGGMYVTGGLTPKNIKLIEGADSSFMKAYSDKGRLSKLLDSVPLFAVMTEDIGLRGARVCAEREYKYLSN